MLAFSNDYYGIIFRATQSVELFCAYGRTDVVLLCCEISIRKSEVKGIEEKLRKKAVEMQL